VKRQPAAFLDRDGTINEKAAEGDYVKGPDELRLLAGAADAIRSLNDAGVLVIVVTNQRGIALGRMTEVDLQAVHARLRDLLDLSGGARVDEFLFCPHEHGQCTCRKPAPGMLQAACQRFPCIERADSVVIGDSASDIEAGRRFGVRGLLLGRDAPSLRGAVELFLGHGQSGPGFP
jgi:D-glycero-D-manno-heptose 1,7-bisphosphate phosphatase